MLLYCLPHRWLVPAVSDLALHLHAHLADVRHGLAAGRDDEGQGLVEEDFSVDGQADLLEGVDGCDFEVEAGILCDHLAQTGDEGVYPVHSVGLGQVGDALDGCCSDGGDAVLEVVEDERLEELDKEVGVLHKQRDTCTLTANSVMCLVSSSLTLHLLSSEQIFSEG